MYILTQYTTHTHNCTHHTSSPPAVHTPATARITHHHRPLYTHSQLHASRIITARCTHTRNCMHHTSPPPAAHTPATARITHHHHPLYTHPQLHASHIITARCTHHHHPLYTHSQLHASHIITTRCTHTRHQPLHTSLIITRCMYYPSSTCTHNSSSTSGYPSPAYVSTLSAIQ